MKVFLVAAVLLVFPTVASAHLEGNAKEDNGYRVELGHFPQEIMPARSTIFSVVMENLEAKPIFETKAWVRISRGNEILFSSSDLSTEDGTIDFEYQFERAGDYEMLIRMVDLDEDAESTVMFPLAVGSTENTDTTAKETLRVQRQSNFNLAVLTLIIGLIGGVLLARYRPSPNGKS